MSIQTQEHSYKIRSTQKAPAGSAADSPFRHTTVLRSAVWLRRVWLSRLANRLMSIQGLTRPQNIRRCRVLSQPVHNGEKPFLQAGRQNVYFLYRSSFRRPRSQTRSVGALIIVQIDDPFHSRPLGPAGPRFLSSRERQASRRNSRQFPENLGRPVRWKDKSYRHRRDRADRRPCLLADSLLAARLLGLRIRSL